MTMGWMETIRFIGLDLQVATVLAGAGLDLVARAPWSATSRLCRTWWQTRTPSRVPRMGTMGAEQRAVGAARL